MDELQRRLRPEMGLMANTSIPSWYAPTFSEQMTRHTSQLPQKTIQTSTVFTVCSDPTTHAQQHNIKALPG